MKCSKKTRVGNLLLNEPFDFRYNKKRLLADVMILFFLLGNDYINSSPSVFRLDVLYDEILPLYKKNKMHLVDRDFILILPNICHFFQTISVFEEKWLKLINNKSRVMMECLKG